MPNKNEHTVLSFVKRVNVLLLGSEQVPNCQHKQKTNMCQFNITNSVQRA